MKRLICILITAAFLPIHAFAYDRDAYREKADEIKELIEQCEEQGINVQYEKTDSNILDIYADRIQEFADGNLSENITSFQQTELDDIYNEVKANLDGSALDVARKTLYAAEKENSKVCVLIRPNYKWDETIKTKY